MKVLFCNREEAEEFSSRAYLERFAVISITDPGSKPARLRETAECVGILRLEFHDLDRPIDGLDDYKLFMPDDARQIADFVRGVKSKIGTLLIHCEAGISRSASVAAAVLDAEHRLAESQRLFQRAIPNRRVYRMVLDAFGDTGLAP